MTAAPPGPLHGIRVVDVTSTFIGPYATMLMAQWGADVVKIEPPGGDVVRQVGDRHGRGMGPVFLNINRGKRSLMLDLKRPAATKILSQLIESSAVVVHNVRPEAARRLGLSAEAVLAINPSCVHVAFRGFGAGGPYQDKAAYDDIIQAASGLAALQGTATEGEYVRSSIADKIVGLMGAAAALAALHRRDRDGVGSAIEIPMFEAMVGFNLLEQQGGRTFVPASGASGYSRTSSPFRRPYRTKDGQIAVMMYTDQQWHRFFELIGRSELSHDPTLATLRARSLHADAAYGVVDRVMVERTTAEWLQALDAVDIPASNVNSLDDIFDDQHLAEAGFFRSVQHASEGELLLPSMVGPVDGGDHVWHAPSLGQHTGEVLASLGMSAAEVDDLRGQGVLG